MGLFNLVKNPAVVMSHNLSLSFSAASRSPARADFHGLCCCKSPARSALPPCSHSSEEEDGRRGGWPRSPTTEVTVGRETLTMQDRFLTFTTAETFPLRMCCAAGNMQIIIMHFTKAFWSEISTEFGFLMPSQMDSTYLNVCLMKSENERYVSGDGDHL